MNRSLRTLLCAVSGMLLFYSAVTAQPLGKKSEVKEVEEDIRTLNLINSLHLTKSQILALLTKAREAEIKREAYRSELEELTGYSEASLAEMRAKSMKNEELPKYLTREVGSSQKRFRDLKDKGEEEILEMARDVAKILNENQLVMVDKYKPCVVPYRDLTHPERVGQAEASAGMERQLERVHKLPEAIYQQKKKEIIERMVAHMEKKARKEIDVKEEKKRLAKIFNEARALSELEFDLEKAELAKEILPEENKVQTEKQRLKKVARFFLSPRIIPVLEEKLSQE